MTRYLTAAWAGIYAAVALVWTITGKGFPFNPVNPDNDMSLLRHVPPNIGSPLFAIVLLATAVAALAMSGPHAVRLQGLPRLGLLTFGWLVVAGLLFVVPDVTLLMLAGYAPMLIIGAPFGWPPVEYSEIFTWPLINQIWSVLGGLLLARTLLKWQLATKAACTACGRTESPSTWTSPEAARRWGHVSACVAAVIPVTYAVSRLSWLVGIPLGITDEMLRHLKESGAVWAGAGLGAFAVVGGILTLGLVQRWGEVFPRWMVGLAGKRVPIKLAVVPALSVAVAVTSASVSLLSNAKTLELAFSSNGMALWPMFLWPLWAVALAAATLAYYLRRRGHCSACGRDGLTNNLEPGRSVQESISDNA